MSLTITNIRLFSEWDVYYYQTDNRPLNDLITNQDAIVEYISANESTWSGGLSYNLPIASASTLGGVKIGSGLSIDSGTGILTAIPSTPFATIATTSTAGLVKVGSGLDIDSVTGVLVANYTIAPATSTTIGGVKVGSGLTVDSHGLISAVFPGMYVLPLATASSLGGVKIGSGLVSVGTDGTIAVDFTVNSTPIDNTTKAITPAYLQAVLAGTTGTPTSGTLLSHTLISTVGAWTYTVSNPATTQVKLTISGAGGGGGGGDYVSDQTGSTTGVGQTGGNAGLSIITLSASTSSLKTFNGVVGGKGSGGLGANSSNISSGDPGGTTTCYKESLSTGHTLVLTATGGAGGLFTYPGTAAAGTATGGSSNTTGGGASGGVGGSDSDAGPGADGQDGYVIIEELT